MAFSKGELFESFDEFEVKLTGFQENQRKRNISNCQRRSFDHPNMPSYKLYYFNGRGRAEICRLLFVMAGQEFEDNRLDSDQWKQLKDKTPVGQMPALEIDGRMFAQSAAIATYLAKEFGLYGKTNIEGLQIDEISWTLMDFISQRVKAMYAEESKKEAALKEFQENQVPKYLTALTKRLKESGTGYFVGSSVTLADIFVYDALFSFNVRHEGMLDSYPELKTHMEKIGNLDKIKAYVAKRPDTPF